MKPPRFVRPLSSEECQILRAGLRSPSAFTLRRSQILLAGAAGLKPSEIRARLGCATQTVRDALRAFAAEGTACLREKSHRPKSVRSALDDVGRERLRALLHRSPRDFGKTTGIWTLATAAEVGHERGLTERSVSGETIRQALRRRGIGWKRAKTWTASITADGAGPSRRANRKVENIKGVSNCKEVYCLPVASLHALRSSSNRMGF